MRRSRRIAAAMAAIPLVIGACTWVANATGPSASVDCTITDGTLSCPLPPSETVTETLAAPTATVTAPGPTETVTEPGPTTTVTEPGPTTTVTTIVTAQPPSTSTAPPASAAPTSSSAAPVAPTSSAAPSPTAAPTAAKNCAAAPSACGYPDATNTGPAAGTFTNVPGQRTSGTGWEWEANFGRLRITGAGAVLDRLNVTGPIVIDAPNVTIRNSIVTTCGFDADVIAIRAGNPANGYDARNATVTSSKLASCADMSKRARSNVRDVYGAATGALVVGNDLSGAGNCVTIEASGTVRDNWCHDLGHVAGDHHSGFSNHGGSSGLVIQHNTALLANTSTAGGGGLSGAMTVYGDFARAQNVTAKDNLISGGAYTMYGGINNEATYGQPLNVQLLANRLVCDSWVYGPMFVRATTVVDGNYCDQTLSPVSR